MQDSRRQRQEQPCTADAERFDIAHLERHRGRFAAVNEGSHPNTAQLPRTCSNVMLQHIADRKVASTIPRQTVRRARTLRPPCQQGDEVTC